jgi:ribonuclease E
MASNKMLIDASHPEETRVVVLRGNRIEEFDFESQNKRQLKGNIYLAKVTRVEPSLQAAFVDYGGNRHGFLAFSEIHPDYYQIPVADRQALLDEEAADARRDETDEGEDQADENVNLDYTQSDDSPPVGETVSAATKKTGETDETAAESKPKRRRRARKKPNKEVQAVEPAVTALDEETSEQESAVDGVETISDDGNPTEEKVVKKPRARRSTKRATKSTTKIDKDKNADDSEETVAEIANVETARIDKDTSTIELPENSQENAEVETNIENLTSDPEKPTSIAAMMETDSISEPAPDDAGEEEEPDGADESELPKEAPAARKRSRSTRRPRKNAKVDSQDESDEETIIVKEPAPVVDASADAEPDTKPKKPIEVAEETQSEENTATGESATDDEGKEEAPKPKARRRKRATRARKNVAKDKDESEIAKSEGSNAEEERYNLTQSASNQNGDDDSEEVQSSGQEDALEEVPQRRRSRRQYKIQEVVKRRQVLLVQVVKEERGNKGAALTTYLSLAGRYSVLMPNTARGGGISRKITNAADRKRLKAIAGELEVPEGMGVILRTAGASRTKEEIQRDFEYLMRLWENVRSLTLSSSAPCLVYEEGSLIKRSIRDLYDKNTGEVTVAGEAGFNEAKSFMTMLMPSHADRVNLYQDEQAMFARFGIEQQLDKMLSQQVTLKSGGYLVIDQTEALVAVDVNSGRATREHSIEDTALQTNLETAEEVARQLRFRDLAGLIVIDFIDMEEKRNNRAVEKKLKECLKHDRARIQVGRISHFGLLEMSRQRMRASVLDSTMEVCANCQGKGYIRSNSSVSLHLLRAIEEHLLKNSRFDLMIAAATDIASYILNHKRNALMEIEERFGIRIFIEGRHDLIGENYNIEKGEPSIGERKPVNHIQVGEVSNLPEAGGSEEQISESQSGEELSEKPKRRRRRGRGNKDEGSVEVKQNDSEKVSEENENESGNRKRQRGRRSGRSRNKQTDDVQTGDEDAPVQTRSIDAQPIIDEVQPSSIAEQAEEDIKPAKRNSRPRKSKPKTLAIEAVPEEMKTGSEAAVSEVSTSSENDVENNIVNQAEPQRAKRRTTRRRPAPMPEEAEVSDHEKPVVPATEADPHVRMDTAIDVQGKTAGDDLAASAEEPKEDGKKRGGWWSRNGFFK